MDRRTKVDSPLNPRASASGKAVSPDVTTVPARLPETVCHRTIPGDPALLSQAEFHGQTIYFCSETCLRIFLSDPEGFLEAHGKVRA
jgi:YHS domain-containing protein